MEKTDLCRRCGICCHTGFNIKDNIIALPFFRCKFLKKERVDLYFCNVYEKRFEVAWWCLDVNNAIKKQALAQDCPYVFNNPQYRGRKFLKGSLIKSFFPFVYETIMKYGIPDFVDVDGCYEFFIEWEFYNKRFLNALKIKELYQIFEKEGKFLFKNRTI